MNYIDLVNGGYPGLLTNLICPFAVLPARRTRLWQAGQVWYSLSITGYVELNITCVM